MTQGNEAQQLIAQGLGECSSLANSAPESTSPLSEFNRQAAANWALVHAEDAQSYSDDECTWFVSNALWAGGIPKSDAWTDQGDHGHLHPLPGTVDAWVPQDLKDYLLQIYPKSTYSQLDFSQNSVPDAQPGDVILYDWQGDGSLDHAAIVVDDAAGSQYPEVSEWGNVDKAGESYPSQKQGWTFSRVYNNWIQAVYSNPKAYLLHIDTGLDGVQVLGDPGNGNVA